MNNFPAQQHSATLVIALAILVTITLLAVSSTREMVLESRIAGNIIGQTRLWDAAGSGPREGERRFINTLHPPKPGTGHMADNVTCPCLPGLAALKLKLADTHQNPIGVPKGIANTWVSYHGSDVTSTTTAGTLYNMQWNNLPISSGGQVNETEGPEYGNLVRGTSTLYYETNSIARNQTNGETALQTVLTRLHTN